MQLVRFVLRQLLVVTHLVHIWLCLVGSDIKVTVGELLDVLTHASTLIAVAEQCEIGILRGAGVAIVVAGHLYKLWEVTIEKGSRS